MASSRWIRTVAAAAVAVVGTVTTVATGAGAAPASPTGSPSPAPSMSYCPPLPPVNGTFAEAGPDSLTFRFQLPGGTPGCPVGRVTVQVFSSLEDARMMRDSRGQATSEAGQTSGTLTVTGLRGAYWYRFLGNSSFYSLPAGPVSTTVDGPLCTASVTLTDTWTTGFVARVTVRNTGAVPVRGWTVSWAAPGDHQVNGIWNAVTTTPVGGATGAAANAAYNGELAPGAQTAFGFVAASDAPGSSFAAVGCRATG